MPNKARLRLAYMSNSFVVSMFPAPFQLSAMNTLNG